MANRNTQKAKTFTFLGAEYEAPATLNENIRAWFRHNSPHETTAQHDTQQCAFLCREERTDGNDL